MTRTLFLLCACMLFSSTAAECPATPARDFAEIRCTIGADGANQECVVICESGFELPPDSEDPLQGTVTCQEDDTWDKAFPYCQRTCFFRAKADVAFLVDSSGSMARTSSKELVKEFVTDLISQWPISNQNMKVAIVPYNLDLLYDSVIDLNGFSDDKEGLLQAVENLPENSPGSLTGNALRFTQNTILAPASGDRPDAPDIVITLTDGREQDETKAPIEQLTTSGVSTYGVGFYPRRGMELLIDHLETLSGNDSARVHITEKRSLGDFSELVEDMEKIYCPPVVCDPSLPSTPENGEMACSNGNNVGSVCAFTCDEGYTLEGDKISNCVPNFTGAAWIGRTPVCNRIECNPPITNIENGEVSCSDENFIGSVCTFTCTTPGFELYPADRTEVSCLSSATWDQDPPCCARSCPPFASTDVVFLLDSSSSIGNTNWEVVKGFVKGIIENFTVSSDWANFAAVRYTRRVHTEDQILLRDYQNDREGLLAAVDDMSYNGRGTNTGRGIQYVVDNVLTEEAGDRPGVEDVMIIITDGRARDDVLLSANQLRARNVNTYVIAIPPGNKKLDEEQLLQIAGSDSNLFLLEGFEDLDDEFAKTIQSKVCVGDTDADRCSR